ncbi:MAG: histidine kinase dimerization/phospho-acceptor domain-containing protein [Chloroflexota bacterium]
MVQHQALQSDHSLAILSVVIDKSPAGLLLLDGNRITLANPVALDILALSASAVGTVLHIESPDGALIERIGESLKSGGAAFDYRIPANDERSEYTLRIEAVALADLNQILVRIDNVTVARRVEARWSESVAHAFHELKTPLAVLSLGLSNLSTYYARLSDEQRVATIDDLADQVREMNEILADLFQQMRGTPPLTRVSVEADKN